MAADKQPSTSTIIASTTAYVRNTLKNAEAGHDWWHIHRVLNNARLINAQENADTLVVELAALLHDIADSKFHNGDEEIGPNTAAAWMQSIGVNASVVEHVVQIIRHMSFKSSFDGPGFVSLEMQVVQDADRLDAIGAIGIARAFTYGGFKGRELYNPDIPPNLNMTKEEYKNSSSPTINHFYEKLLLLKDRMNTQAGMALAQERHEFMMKFLNQFYKEFA